MSGWLLLILLGGCLGTTILLIGQNWQIITLQLFAWHIAGPAAAFFILVAAGGAFASAVWFAGRYVSFAKILKEAAPVMQQLDRKVKEQTKRIEELEIQLRQGREHPPATPGRDQDS